MADFTKAKLEPVKYVSKEEREKIIATDDARRASAPKPAEAITAGPSRPGARAPHAPGKTASRLEL